ncbi:MAG: DNA polymerase II large subunit, partial [Asgard group archaeon]|nr:DNA polymerase II large subunit [Asgard group archaeon]
VHTLYPLEMKGKGNKRLVVEGGKNDKIEVTVVHRECPQCHQITHLPLCPQCNIRTKLLKTCRICGRELESDFCESCRQPAVYYSTRLIDVSKDIQRVRQQLGANIHSGTKGVKKLMNKKRIPELLEKGFLRARHDLNVYKDGTIRFDSTDIPLMHFTPKEINATIEQLKAMGYSYDIQGEPLENEEQMLELKIQDVVLNIQNGEFFVRVSRYVDDLLTSVYGMEPFYKVNRITDLIGHYVIGLAPHTSSGITGRIIGFTSVKGNLAHPYWHAAKRRNCDGDEDAVILMLEGFLDFSKEYLPITRGGSMDAPLTLGITINPLEVDDESHAVDCSSRYPLELYTQSYKFLDPKKMAQIIDIIENRLETKEQFENFAYTHPTSNISIGPSATSYTRLGKMNDKLKAQLKVAEIVRATEPEDVAERVINRHFFPDMLGCMRAFGAQTFRCIKCNTKYRRLPLSGKCKKCKSGGKLVLTVHKKTITKYYPIAEELANKYSLSDYVKQRLLLFDEVINESFIPEDENQSSLMEFFQK